MFKYPICCLMLLTCFAGVGHAQAMPDSSQSGSQTPSSEERHVLTSPEAEMRYKAAVKHEQSVHQELQERADEAAHIGTEIRSAYERNKVLTRDDLKKLERMEKLTRKIRSSAGGSDDDELLKDPPRQLDAAVAKLVELSDLIDKKVKKTSRLVISAGVIQNSNELIQVIKHIRTLIQP